MIYGFLAGVTYHNDWDEDLYLEVINVIQWNDYFQVWGIWYTKQGDFRYKEDRNIEVDKKDLGVWHYGKYGPC